MRKVLETGAFADKSRKRIVDCPAGVHNGECGAKAFASAGGHAYIDVIFNPFLPSARRRADIAVFTVLS